MSVVDAAADVAPIRRFYAEEIAMLGGVESPAILEAFATVPRERFLGPGPWNLCLSDTGQSFKYRQTPDDHPRHVYHNVPIAIDEARILNNGQPSLLATWMQWLDLTPGARIVHIGSGTGNSQQSSRRSPDRTGGSPPSRSIRRCRPAPAPTSRTTRTSL